MTGNHPSRRYGTSRLERASSADFRLCRVEHRTIFPRELFAGQGLTRRAQKCVAFRLISKFRAVDQRAISVIVHAAVGRHMRQDALSLAGFGLLAIRVA